MTKKAAPIKPKLGPGFWLVWRETGGWSDTVPRHKHDTLKSARIEAARLAVANPGIRFFVLAASDFAVAEINPVAWRRSQSPHSNGVKDGTPF